MIVPPWALTVSYWLHMLATVAWLGGLAAVSLILIPALDKLADPQARLDILHRAQKRLDPLGWFSLLLLTGTGLVQMSASPAYDGFLSITNRWALAILLKHIVFLGMMGVSVFITWKAMPDLERAILRQSLGKAAQDIPQLMRRNVALIRLNLFLGAIVLIFTALARVSI